MYDAYIKNSQHLGTVSKRLGGGGARAKRRIGGLGPRAVVRGLKLFLPPKKQFGLIVMHQYKLEVRTVYEGNTPRVWSRALDKREYLMIIKDNFCYFCIKTYVVTLHRNRLIKSVQMRVHIIWFQ